MGIGELGSGQLLCFYLVLRAGIKQEVGEGLGR